MKELAKTYDCLLYTSPASLKDTLAQKDQFPQEEIFGKACTEEIEELDQRVSGKEVFRMEHLNFEDVYKRQGPGTGGAGDCISRGSA